jgi:hypothetical protein
MPQPTQALASSNLTWRYANGFYVFWAVKRAGIADDALFIEAAFQKKGSPILCQEHAIECEARKLLDAVQKMKEDPSRSIFRSRSQTALICCDKESW